MTHLHPAILASTTTTIHDNRRSQSHTHLWRPAVHVLQAVQPLLLAAPATHSQAAAQLQPRQQQPRQRLLKRHMPQHAASAARQAVEVPAAGRHHT